MAQGLADLVNSQQRCQWHVVRDLNYYLWDQQAPKNERALLQKRLHGMLGIELPESDFERVAAQDKLGLERLTQDAEEQVDSLVNELEHRGYGKAATYVRNAKAHLFSYVRLWLRTGLVAPRVSSMIERMMREIGRRIKRIGFNWKPEGAAKMARIVLKRFTSANEWDEYWRGRLNIQQKVFLAYRGVRVHG